MLKHMPTETLFGAAMTTPALFAAIVFDRPLDVPYTYGVPESLRETIAVGKRVLVPFGRGDKPTNGFCVGLSDHPPDRAVKFVAQVLDDVALLDDHLLRLTRWMADYYLCGWGQVLQAVVPAGVRDRAGTKSQLLIEAVSQDELPDPLPTVTAKQKAVLERLRQESAPIEQNRLAKELNIGVGVIAGLVEKKLARKSSERVERLDRSETASDESNRTAHLLLSDDQAKAWQAIEPALAGGEFKPFLIHGVTGSGKTELYLRAIEEVIKQGKEAIVLVPEISLTPQTIERFRGRLGEVAVLHSHLTNSERAADWRRVASGHVNVVVGARSAVFAPTRKLGLIVIDEEHETTFKQDSTPRYHARDVAVMRASLERIPILLGSATPSLESYYNAKRGTYSYLDLPTRVESRPLPDVHLVDLRHEPKSRGKFFALSPTLDREMKIALDAGGQVMLLLNRRGYSTHVQCPGCGHVAQCPHCDLGLTFHRAKNCLLCHHCGHEEPPMANCTKCGQPSVKYQGLGTEKLQQEVEEKFPHVVCKRMDSDTMDKPGSHQRVLESFRAGAIQVLVGTQMIAKGLDFPNVTLVGVINADVGLNLPDFRAAERTFQLLAQVAGRTGRGDKGGHVFIQTFTPEHPCIALAAKHLFEPFADQELAVRKQHKYPPYQRMARIVIRGKDADKASAFADLLSGAFKQATARRPNATPIRILGPAECPVFKLKDLFRFHFQIQSESSAVLHEVLREVLVVAKPPSGIEFQVDVDPYGML
jgi:primosomal protein N' (replication factor Y)